MLRFVDRCLEPRESQVLLGRHDTNSIRVSQTTAPALHTDYTVTFLQDTEFNRLGNTPLQAAVNIFLPDGRAEIGLLLREEKWVYAAIKVRVLVLSASARKQKDRITYAGSRFIASNH